MGLSETFTVGKLKALLKEFPDEVVLGLAQTDKLAALQQFTKATGASLLWAAISPAPKGTVVGNAPWDTFALGLLALPLNAKVAAPGEGDAAGLEAAPRILRP